MAKNEKQPPVILTLNDVEYDVNEDFNDEQKQMYLHLKNIDDKINSNNFIQQQLAVSKDGFVRMLEESLAKSDDHSPHDPGDENDQMIVRYAYDNDVVIHLNNKKGMSKKVKLADGTLITLTYPTSKKYFLRNGENIIKKSDSFKTIEEAYVKECNNLKDSDNHGRIDIVKHKLVNSKVEER